MPAFPISLRLLATPLWGLAVARAWIVEWGGPMVTLRVDAQHPLPPASALLELVDAPDVRGLRLLLSGAGGGFASLLAARRALQQIRAAGKLVVAELDHAGNAELYLASVADRVWLRPERPVWALGVAAVMRFWADALLKVGVTVDVEAVGEFKSFGEQYSRRFPTAQNREATRVLVDDLQAELEQGIAEGRGISVEAVRAAMAAAPMTAEVALSHHLADAILYQDAAKAQLETLLGGEKLREVPFARWFAAHRLRKRLAGWIEGAPVVVAVHLEGPVVDGEGAPGAPVIAELPTLRVLEALAEDPKVRGVVLFIRSPGGSASASDAIWRGVKRLNDGKPVVAALSDVAASGGYYIAVGATEIVAESSTLTCSIGVIAARPVVRAALERLGVHTEIVKGAPMADFFTEGEWSPEARGRYRALLQAMYKTFVERVAAGRHQPFDAVEPHARGRVWTGRRALELGLVDSLGGLDHAVARVAHRASLRHPRRVDIFVAKRGNRLLRLLRNAIGAMVPELRWLPVPGTGARLLLESDGAPLYAWPADLDVR